MAIVYGNISFLIFDIDGDNRNELLIQSGKGIHESKIIVKLNKNEEKIAQTFIKMLKRKIIGTKGVWVDDFGDGISISRVR